MKKKQPKKDKHTRKAWFRGLKGFLRLFIRRTKFIRLDGSDEAIKDGSVIICNHSGAGGPLSWELYSNLPFRFWGTYLMNGSLPMVYRYLSRTYYHEKKHWNLHLSRLFCLLAAPLTFMFYRGLRLISTYPDARFLKTVRTSIETLEKNQSLVVFPEDSSKGYFDKLKYFHNGVVSFCHMATKHGLDVPVYVAYHNKKKKKTLIDRPIMMSQLLKIADNYDDIAMALRLRCNKLGDMLDSENFEQSLKDLGASAVNPPPCKQATSNNGEDTLDALTPKIDESEITQITQPAKLA